MSSTLELDRAHVFHSWSAQGNLHPLAVDHAEGVRVWLEDGRELLDFSSQLVNVNIGYSHPKVVAAIQEQAAKLATIAPGHAVRVRGEAAKRIVSHAPEGFNKVFFTNAGADANENAIRMARLFTGRDKILSGYRSYHGNTGAAVVASGDWRRIPNEYARGHVHFYQPYLYRSEFYATSEQEECERALHYLRRTIENEGPSAIAAILLETIPGTAGILVPPAGYLEGVRALADEFGIVLILDEVMAGFGRTGDWFALDGFNVRPDLITFAKGVNSGYVPTGGVIISDPIAHHFDDTVFPGGLTYSGHPLAMAAVVANLDAFESEGVVTNAKTIGDTVIGPRLAGLADKYPGLVGEVRGRGVFWAIELVANADTREPLPAATMATVKSRLLDAGLLPFIADNRIHVVPPCVISAEDAALGIDIIDQVLSTL
ncbi:MAG TPA: aspartate aminotransferase family protein [Pseudoclavibacter sp.]|nr:aspartate aminotransferase family protein [Pseudoclavibacter sp.]